MVMLATLTLVSSTSITQAQPSDDTVQIIVKFKDADNTSAVDTAIQASHGKALRHFSQLHTHVISVPAAAADNVLSTLANNPHVERASKAVKFHKAGTPDDPLYSQQWALPKMSWDQVYDIRNFTGSATIAVLDTGIDSGHPDFAGRIVSGQSFVDGDASCDPNGHGTALAGIAAANVNNAVGIAGVAYAGTTLSSVQVLQPDGTGLDSDIVAGMLWAADNGANVILMGFSSPDYSDALADAIQYAWNKGCVLVAATGNDGSTAPSYPAGMEHVLGVASTDQDDNVAADSNTGSANVAAPGVGIYTTFIGGNYYTISGTSAAAANVAGLAALLTANGQNNDYVFDQIRGAVDPVPNQWFGRINIATAMGEAATPPIIPAPVPTPEPGPTPPVYAPAATRTASASGNWNNTATWGGAAVPTSNDNVFINNGYTVTVNVSDAVCSTLTVGTTNNTTSTLSFLNSVSQLTIGTWLSVGGNGNRRGSINMSSGGTLKIGTTVSINGTRGTWTPGTGTVEYYGAAQTLPTTWMTTYNNLTLSGSGQKAIGTININGILSIEGTATTTGTTPTYGAAATLQYKGTSAQTTGTEFPATWSGSGGVIIANTSGSAVTLNQGKVINAPLTINTGAILNTGSYALTFGGNFINSGTFTAGTSTITISGTGTQSIAGFSTSGIVSMTKTGGTATLTGNVNGIALTLDGSGGTLNLGTGLTHTINGDVTLTAGTLNGGSSTLSLTGNWNNSGTFTANSSTITLNGTSTQSVTGATTFYNLTLNNSNGLNLNNNATINNILNLTSSKITTGGSTVIIGTGGSVSRTSGYIIGNLQKNVSSGTNVSCTFEIGTTSGYNPVTVIFNSVGTAGNLTAKATPGDHPSIASSTINSSKSVNLYWSLTNSGIGFTNYSATFNFNSGDIDSGANTSTFIVGNFNGSTWAYPAVGTRTSTSTQATGLASFGDFAIGESNIYISFTVTDYSGDGIKFGSLNPGTTDQPADQTPSQGAVTLTVSTETNVDVNVQIRGDNFSGPGNISIANVKYNSVNTTLGASTMQTSYVTWYTVSAYAGDVHQCYHWISIPAGQTPGDYSSTFYYQATQ